MTTEGKHMIENVTAGADLTAGQYKAIALDDGDFAANGGEAFGILQNKPLAGQQASVAFFGVCKAYFGLPAAAGASITVAASGWCQPATLGDIINGRALKAVTSGSVGKIFFGTANTLVSTTAAAY